MSVTIIDFALRYRVISLIDFTHHESGFGWYRNKNYFDTGMDLNPSNLVWDKMRVISCGHGAKKVNGLLSMKFSRMQVELYKSHLATAPSHPDV